MLFLKNKQTLILILLCSFQVNAENIAENIAENRAETEAKKIPILIETIKNKPADRYMALSELGKMTSVKKNKVVPTLIKILKDKNEFPMDRLVVAAFLGRFMPTSLTAAEALFTIINDKSMENRGDYYELRKVAVLSLGRMGPAVKKMIPENKLLFSLVKITLNENEGRYMISNTSDAIELINPDPRNLVPIYIDFINKGNSGERLWSIHALGFIGPPATDAIPVITKILRNSTFNENDSPRPSLALGNKLDLRIAESNFQNMRYAALQSLAKIAPNDPNIISLFNEIKTNDPDESLRKSAGYLLNK